MDLLQYYQLLVFPAGYGDLQADKTTKAIGLIT